MTDSLVVFGASGDMARRLLLPALYKLDAIGKLPDLRILGYALESWDTDRFKEQARKGVVSLANLQLDETAWARFSQRLSYVAGDLSPPGLSAVVDAVKGNAVFYLALPPSVFATAASALASAGLNDQSAGWRRLVIEKPFGVDVETAVELNKALHASWPESSIFRIDHYLGKETVQNIMVFRFANRFIDPMLNANHVAHVQITAAETLGLEGRYRYYDGIGAMRDMLQSHLLQLLAVVAMEPPSLWDSEIFHDHKAEVLRSIRPIDGQNIDGIAVRGQYTAGQSNGAAVSGYLTEPGIRPNSSTETFAAVKLFIDNWRWSGVPFYLRSGKRLSSDLTEIAIQFRAPPKRLFENSGINQLDENQLIFQLRPSESVNLTVQAREPGLELKARPLTLNADYAKSPDKDSSSYEQLILDVVAGDQTPFVRFDEVEWAWRVLQPVLDAWKTGRPEDYASGSNGPAGQHRLLDNGHEWRSLAG